MSESDGSGVDGVALTVKQIVLELREDMKVVRPIAESLDSANVPVRLAALEMDKVRRDDAQPVLLAAVTRMTEQLNVLWTERANRIARGETLGVIAKVTSRTGTIALLISQLLLAIWIAYATHVHVGP